MSLKLRPGTKEDAAACGVIIYEAFKSIADQHNFPPDIPSVQEGTRAATMLLSNKGVYSVVAELDGRTVGSNFMDERSGIAGIGPISVDPQVQNRGIGAQLMRNVMERAKARGFPGVRLVQAGYHNRSLCLYTRLGFDTREPLSTMQGKPLGLTIPGYDVRPAAEADLDACNQLCARVHGHDRGGELREAVARGAAAVVEHLGRISGYATSIAFFAHAVGETNEDIKALIGAAREFGGPGFLVPTRNGELMRWCLGEGLRIAQTLTLMSTGLYSDPAGAWLPSVLY
jgi:predicted N-acetyltransferase YhbS